MIIQSKSNARIAWLVAVVLTTTFLPGTGHASDSKRWQVAQSADTIEAYREYLAAGKGKHLTEANNRIAELRYQQALRENTLTAYDRFIAEFYWTTQAQELQKRRPTLVAEMQARRASEARLLEDQKLHSEFASHRSLVSAVSYLQGMPQGTHRNEVMDWLAAQPDLSALPGGAVYVTLESNSVLPNVKMRTGLATWGVNGFDVERKILQPRAGTRIVVLAFLLVNTAASYQLDLAKVALTDRAGTSHRTFGWLFGADELGNTTSVEVGDRVRRTKLLFMLPKTDLDSLVLTVDGNKIASLAALRTKVQVE